MQTVEGKGIISRLPALAAVAASVAVPYTSPEIKVIGFDGSDNNIPGGNFSLDATFATGSNATMTFTAQWTNDTDYDANTAVTIVAGMAAGRRGYSFALPLCKAFKVVATPTAGATISKLDVAVG